MNGRSDALDARVYPFREDSALLLPYAPVGPGRWLLELGCGEGRAALVAARSGGRVVASDLNPFAVRYAVARARAEGLGILGVRTDLFRGLGRFDRVLANPPYLPTLPDARDPDPWVNLALDGGADGRGISRRIVSELSDHLSPGGSGYLVLSSEQSAEAGYVVLDAWGPNGPPPRRVAERTIEGERLEVWEFSRQPRGY